MSTLLFFLHKLLVRIHERVNNMCNNNKTNQKGNCPQPGCRSLSVFISDKHGVHRSKGKKTKTFPKINDSDKGKIKNS